MAQKGLIRIATGFALVFGAVGGMEHSPEASLSLQLLTAAVGLALMMWAARDINHNANRVVDRLAQKQYN